MQRPTDDWCGRVADALMWVVSGLSLALGLTLAWVFITGAG